MTYTHKEPINPSHTTPSVVRFQTWQVLFGPFLLSTTTPTQIPTIDAKGVLNLQAGAGLLTEYRCHAQHIFKGEHVVVGEYPADAVSERVDL